MGKYIWPIRKLKTSEAQQYGNHHKGQDEDKTNPIYALVLFQPDTKNFPEGDKNENFHTWTGLKINNC